MSISKSGKIIVSGSHDKTIKIWDVYSGNNIKTLYTISNVNSVYFSSDSKLIVSGSYDTTIKIWDV